MHESFGVKGGYKLLWSPRARNWNNDDKRVTKIQSIVRLRTSWIVGLLVNPNIANDHISGSSASLSCLAVNPLDNPSYKLGRLRILPSRTGVDRGKSCPRLHGLECNPKAMGGAAAIGTDNIAKCVQRASTSTTFCSYYRGMKSEISTAWPKTASTRRVPEAFSTKKNRVDRLP